MHPKQHTMKAISSENTGGGRPHPLRAQAFQADCEAFSASFLRKNLFAVLLLLVVGLFAPLSFSDTTALRSAQIELAKMSYQLKKCREACLTNCRASGVSICSEDVCDRGMCKASKRAYDVSKQSHTQAQQALQAAHRQALIN